MDMALSCTFYNDFLVKGTVPAKKKPICTINTLSYACLLKKKMEKVGF